MLPIISVRTAHRCDLLWFYTKHHEGQRLLIPLHSCPIMLDAVVCRILGRLRHSCTMSAAGPTSFT